MEKTFEQVDWTLAEVSLIVADYFQMLQKELSNLNYSKTAHRKLLHTLLKGRNEGAIEFKHQNISAVLQEMGYPYIRGYKPRYHYQQLVVEVLSEYLLTKKTILEPVFTLFSEDATVSKTIDKIDYSKVMDVEPETQSLVKEVFSSFRPIKKNYLQEEQNNRILGARGEELIINFEKWRLIKANKEVLAEKVEWISKDIGDGTGFDILSKNVDGTDRYIEVKTTKLRKETPIFVSANEVRFASTKEKSFFLYRVFDFAKSPRLFVKNGRYENYCSLVPQSFKGYF